MVMRRCHIGSFSKLLTHREFLLSAALTPALLRSSRGRAGLGMTRYRSRRGGTLRLLSHQARDVLLRIRLNMLRYYS